MLIISKMRYYILKIILVFFYTLICCNPAYSNSEKKVTAVELIHSSEQLLKSLIPNEEFDNLDEYIENSRAIILFPEIYEGGLILEPKEKWYIAYEGLKRIFWTFFYSIGGVSFGLQIGAKSAQVLMTIMTNRGLKSLLKERVKLGVDVDMAMINTGVGYSAESTLRLADIYTFSDNTGLFVGGSFEGTYLQPRNDLNNILHGEEFSSDDILKKKDVSKGIESLAKILNNINNYK